MEVAEVGAPLVVRYIGCCFAIRFHWNAPPYFILRSHAFILRGDIGFVIHAWFIHGVTQVWCCPRFHGQFEHVVSPLPKWICCFPSPSRSLPIRHTPQEVN